MALTKFPYSAYNKPSGEPLSKGYILLRLTQDARTSTDTQLCAGSVVRAELDDNGLIASGFQVWSTSDMLPANTQYILRAYTEEGQLVYESPVSVGALGFGTAFGVSFGS